MNNKKAMSFIALLWAIGLSVASMALPPLGIIDNSVLILIAQIIVFIASLTGIELPSLFNRFKNGDNGTKKMAS